MNEMNSNKYKLLEFALLTPTYGLENKEQLMTYKEVQEYVIQQIGDRWSESNAHGVNLRKALVTPYRAKMINSLVNDGKIIDSLLEVWVVLEEVYKGDGYMIFFDEKDDEFGLAFKNNPYPVICGYYGDFWTTLKGM